MKIILTIGLIVGMVLSTFGQIELKINNLELELNKLSETFKDSLFTTIVYEGTNLRKFPSSSSKSIIIFPDEQKATVTGYNNNFFKVCIDSLCGYIDEKSTFPDLRLISFLKVYREVEGEYNNVVLEKKRISINYVNVVRINSARGVDFAINWGYFDKSKVIKYIYFTVVPYNSVGDIQSSEIGNISTFIGKTTGPINNSFVFRNSVWENAWYNNTITCIKLTKVKVEYTDGSIYTYIKELPKILDDNFSNNCDYQE